MNPGIISAPSATGYLGGSSGPTTTSGVFWRGLDGKVYVQGDQGTNSAGDWNGGTSAYWSSRGFREINDPNPTITLPGEIQELSPISTGSTAPSGGGGGSTDPAPIFNQAGANNTQLAIDQIPGLLEAALAAENTRYTNANNSFNAQEAAQRKQAGESTVTNQQNYDRAFMDSIRSGIRGLRGLFQILRGTGAAGGTAETQAGDLVGSAVSRDILSGADTRDENQAAVDAALSTFLTDLRGRREANEDTFANNKRSIRADSDTNLQELYGKMAGFYSDVDDQANYNNWMGKAGALTPQIAQNSRTQVSSYNTSPIEVQTPELRAFSKTGQSNVNAGDVGSGRIGSGIFTMSRPEDRRRERERDDTPVTAGA